MSETSIEWTHRPGTRGATWNPTTGCTECSPGCKNCYAKVMHKRLTAMGQAKYAAPFHTVKPYPPHLDLPLRTKTPTTYFVNSMSDLFHEDLPDDYIAAVFGVMAACPQHTFQVLTKRARRARQWFEWLERRARDCNAGSGMSVAGYCLVLAQRAIPACVALTDHVSRTLAQPWPLPNVWLGVSVEDQARANERIPELLAAPAAVRFLSCEPLLQAIDLERIDATRAGWSAVNGFPEPTAISAFGRWQNEPVRARLQNGVDWVIVGGESGRAARLFHLAWARSLVTQCRAAGVAVFVKQLGRHPVVGYYSDDRQHEEDQYGYAMRVLYPDGSRHDDRDGQPGLDALGLVALRSKKGGVASEWPADLRVRQYPEVAR